MISIKVNLVVLNDRKFFRIAPNQLNRSMAIQGYWYFCFLPCEFSALAQLSKVKPYNTIFVLFKKTHVQHPLSKRRVFFYI